MTSNRPQTLRPDQARCLGLSGNDRFWREADLREIPTFVKCPSSGHSRRSSQRTFALSPIAAPSDRPSPPVRSHRNRPASWLRAPVLVPERRLSGGCQTRKSPLHSIRRLARETSAELGGLSAHASRARTLRVHSGALLNMPTLPRVGTRGVPTP